MSRSRRPASSLTEARNPPDESTSKTVLVIGSYAPSLLNFRGELLRTLAQKGHRTVAAAPDIDANTSAALLNMGVECHSIPIENASLSPSSIYRSWRALGSLMDDVQPDVVLAYTVKPILLAGFSGLRRRGCRGIALVTGLGYAFTGGRENKRRISRIAAWCLYRAALPRFHAVLFQNPDDRSTFSGLGLIRNCSAVEIVDGSGIDLDHFARAPLPHKPSFLMIARLLGDKGVREYGEAALRLKSNYPGVEVALAGYFDGSPDRISQAELDRYVAGGLSFLGRLEDVRPAISNCSVYVLPSYREGTPRSVLEAMAMGRAVITTDAPGCRETVIHGTNGLLVPPRDSFALEFSMKQLIDMPQQIASMGEQSRKRAEFRYDVHKVNEQILRHAGL